MTRCNVENFMKISNKCGVINEPNGEEVNEIYKIFTRNANIIK